MHWRFAIHRYVSLHQASELENLLKTFFFFFPFFFHEIPSLAHVGFAIESSWQVCEILASGKILSSGGKRFSRTTTHFVRPVSTLLVSFCNCLVANWTLRGLKLRFWEKQIDWKCYLWTPWSSVIHREKWTFMYLVEENVTGFVEKILKEMLNAFLNTLEMRILVNDSWCLMNKRYIVESLGTNFFKEKRKFFFLIYFNSLVKRNMFIIHLLNN